MTLDRTELTVMTVKKDMKGIEQSDDAGVTLKLLNPGELEALDGVEPFESPRPEEAKERVETNPHLEAERCRAEDQDAEQQVKSRTTGDSLQDWPKRLPSQCEQRKDEERNNRHQNEAARESVRTKQSEQDQRHTSCAA